MVSNREKEVLNLIAYEYTSYEIAEMLFISKHTADSHRKNLLIKLDAKNTAGLVRKAFEQKLLILE
ncbi:MAG: helix-turn-helix transcriptional regulator [Saprospiraceae bacterium]|nr:helix-turn-helix transcriptional regulator [Saprospiraceae bacterium]